MLYFTCRLAGKTAMLLGIIVLCTSVLQSIDDSVAVLTNLVALRQEEEDEEEQLLAFLAGRPARRKLVVITNYAEVTVQQFDDKQFRRHFRYH